MKVSIIVPVYNVQDYLDECLKSLVQQSFKDYEVILINDGSTDMSLSICERFVKEYDNIKLFSQKNSGQSVARNYGVREARGEYILFVDSDDYIALNALEVLYTAATNTKADIVVGDILNEEQRIANEPQFRYLPCQNRLVDMLDYSKQALEYGVYDIVPWLKLIKRELLIENNITFPEGYFYEDQEYTMRLSTIANCKIIKIRFPFYYYRMSRPGSTTTHTSVKKAKDFLCIIERMQKYLFELTGEAQSVGEEILAIAYYHFVKVWLRVEKSEQIALYKEFYKLFEKTKDMQIVNKLNVNMKKYITAFIDHPRKLRFKEEIKNTAKKILKK